jgi:threonine dehydrogenase-like Zn-dependent dehydrogenase
MDMHQQPKTRPNAIYRITDKHNANQQQESRELPAPSANEVQVAIHSTGLCGSDLHYYNHNRNGDILVREPLTLGHESSGIVTAIGSK